jgi:RNA polymerase sigma factor (sigma-70 family)
MQCLRRTVLLSGAADLSDKQLLECFLDQGEEAAMAALVRKHAPMVWGVCRRFLGNHHDAEDAFQATFLVLVRKASSISPRDKVANWLHGVACKTARKAKAARIRCLSREKQLNHMPEIATVPDDAWQDLVPILDQELDRLPEKYRVALILCELEGKTRKQAARELGLPEGTLAGHLSRGRTMLARRLSRYGLVLSVAETTRLLAANAAATSVPPMLLSSTAKSAMLAATAKAGAATIISTKATLLAEGVIKAMLLTKLKTMAGLVVLTVTLLGGMSAVGHQTLAALQSTKSEAVAADQANAKSLEESGEIRPPTIFAQPAPAKGPLQIEHKSPVLAVAWSPHGKLLITGTKDGTVQITDADTGKALRSIATADSIAGLAISADSKTLAVSRLAFWDIETGNPLWQFPVKNAVGDFWPASFAFGPDGHSFVTVHVGGYSSMRFNMGAGMVAGAIQAAGKGGAGGVVIGGAGAGAFPKANAVMPKVAGVPGAPVARPVAPVKGVSAMALDGSAGGSCDDSGKLFVWDAKTNQHNLVMDIGKTGCLAFISGRPQVAAACDDNTVVVWDWAEKKKVATLTGLTKPAAMLVCSRDGSTLAALADDKTTTVVWNLASNKVRSQRNHRMGDAQTLALSPDGTLAAIAFVDNKTVYVSNAAKRELTNKGPALLLSAKELAAAWADMLSQDHEAAEAAWQKLGAAGDNATGFLREQIRAEAVPNVDLNALQERIAALDSPTFAIREKAVKELTDAGEPAVLPLQRLLEKSPSTEAATRAEMALKKLPKTQNTPERQRVLEAIELLETVHTAKAIDLLREIERDSLIAQIQLEARRALQRITAE